MPQSSRVRPLIGLVLGIVLFATRVGADESAPDPTPVRFRLRADWSSPTNGSWQGSLSVTTGRIVSARALDWRGAPSRLLPVDDREVRFDSGGPVLWSGLEMVVEAPPAGSVILDLDGHRLDTPLEDLLQGSVSHMAWGGWCRVRRDPGDILRVNVERPHLIFSPLEETAFDLEFNLLSVAPQVVPTRLHVELRPARQTTITSAPVEREFQVRTNASEPLHCGVQMRMPDQEGAYDLYLRAEPAGLQPVERVVQFVVLNTNTESALRSSELVTQLVQEIDPAQPAPSGHWYSTRRLLTRTSRLRQFLWTSVRHPFGSSDRGGDHRDAPTYSCRLNVQHPGKPHLLSIDYEDDGTVLLVSSISEQDQEGCWVQSPVTSGVRSSASAPTPGVQGHKVLFWPQTSCPSLSLYIEGTTGVAAVKKLRLHELPQGLPALDVQEPDGPRRPFVLYLDGPDAWQSLGSSRVSDGATALALDDWRTSLDSATHLAEYARFAGYNCVATTVVGSGGAMYPTQLLEPSLALDSGCLAETTPDPMRKDLVELLLRVCERHRLNVVPTIRFDGALLALDRQLDKSDPRATGLVLVSRQGEVWDVDRAHPQRIRRYNPLHPQVQAAMLEVVREFVRRYAGHVGFEALALDLAASSHTVLPGLDWGYDDQTIEQFARDSGVKFSEVDDEGRFAQRHQLLTGPEREAWITWRCRQLSAFYERVLAELEQASSPARLVLALTTLSGSGSEDLREALRQGRTVEDLLRAKGIDLRSWPAPRGILVLRPFVATGSNPEGLYLNSSRELDDLMARLPSRGALCLHEAEVLHLSAAAGEAQKPKERLPEALSVPLVPSGRPSLRRFAESMAGGDCQAIWDGGSAIPLGQEQVQREFARVFRALPADLFQPVETLQPVVVRSYHDSRGTFVYLINDATYSVETSLSFDCRHRAILTSASTGDRLSAQPTDHGLGTKLTLEPFRMISLRLSQPDVSVAQCNVAVPSAAEKGMKAQFDRLSQAMAVLGRDATRTLDGIPPNGDFEQATEAGDIPAHWMGEGDATQWVLDGKTVHSGSSSLRLAGNPASAVVSESFTPPGGRALALNVWLQADRPGLRLRWFLVGNQHGEVVYRSYADVVLRTAWELKQFRARDLPEGQLSDVQIKFQLLDEGTAWIDEARVCALPISNDEQRAISKAVSAIFKAWKDRRLSDFERLADGYWATYLIESVEGSNGSSQSDNAISETAGQM